MSDPDNSTEEQPQAQAQDSLHSTASGNSGKSFRNTLSSRTSGLFAAARASVFGSNGQSGGSVETLRGNTGADFEGYATVHRGNGDGAFAMFDLFSFFGKKNDGLYFLLIKGYHCFVFENDEGKSPKYAIELMNRKAVIQPSHESFIPKVPHPGAERNTTYTTVHLETGLGDIEYKFTFANMKDGLASKFCNVVSAASNEATTEQVRKRLGHEGLLSKRASVRYADTIGAKKAQDQPEVPVSAGEVLAEMPVAGY